MPRIDTPKWVGCVNRAEPAAGIAQGPEGLPRSSTWWWLVRAPGGMLESCQTKRSWEGRVFFFPLPSVKYIYLKHHPVASVKFSDWRGRIDRHWQHVGGNTQREGTHSDLHLGWLPATTEDWDVSWPFYGSCCTGNDVFFFQLTWKTHC